MNPSKTIKPSSQEAEKALAYVLFLYSKTRIWGSGGSILGVRQANFEGSGGRCWGSRRGLGVDFGGPNPDFGSILGVLEVPGSILGQFWVNFRVWQRSGGESGGVF